MVLAQRQKYRSMEQKRSPEIPMDTSSLTKEAKIYNEEKTISLTTGTGKTKQSPVKNETRTLSNTTHTHKKKTQNGLKI